MNKIPSPHDKYVKFNLSIKSNAVELCKNCIPEDILNITDIDTLKISKENSITDVADPDAVNQADKEIDGKLIQQRIDFWITTPNSWGLKNLYSFYRHAYGTV